MGGAYDYMEKAIKGLLYGIVKRIEGGWVCKDSAGIRFGAPVFGYVGDENSAFNTKRECLLRITKRILVEVYELQKMLVEYSQEILES